MPIIISYAYPCSVLHSIKRHGPIILPTPRTIMNESNCSALVFFLANNKMISIERELAFSIGVVNKQLESAGKIISYM